MEMHLGWLSFWFFLMVITVTVGGGLAAENADGDGKVVMGVVTLIAGALVTLMASITIYNVYNINTIHQREIMSYESKYRDLSTNHKTLQQRVKSLDKINAELMVDNVETKIEKRETSKKLKLLNGKRNRMLKNLKTLTSQIEND